MTGQSVIHKKSAEIITEIVVVTVMVAVVVKSNICKVEVIEVVKICSCVE